MKYTDKQIKEAVEYCSKQGITSDCTKCIIVDECRPALMSYVLDLINRQEADIDYWKRNAFDGCMERGRIAETARSEAIKEFWNQRPPMLNPNFKGKEQYNKGWNDCISFFAEEYKILLGIEKRNEKVCPDTAAEMVGEGE